MKMLNGCTAPRGGSMSGEGGADSPKQKQKTSIMIEFSLYTHLYVKNLDTNVASTTPIICSSSTLNCTTMHSTHVFLSLKLGVH